jgi:hypothetical protein
MLAFTAQLSALHRLTPFGRHHLIALHVAFKNYPG